MAVYLKDLYENTKDQYHLEILAGREGLNHIISCIYIAEDLENTSFFRVQELLISTGLSRQGNQDWLFSMVKACIERGSGGLILNVGKYLHRSDISENVISMCDKHNFPLLIMPWEVYLSDITQDYWNRIFVDRQKTDALGNALKTAMTYDIPDPEVEDIFRTYGFLPEDTYHLAILHSEPMDFSVQDTVRVLHHVATLGMMERKDDFISVSRKGQIYILWHNFTQSEIADHTEQFREKCGLRFRDAGFHFGISSSCRLNGLKEADLQAKAALQMAIAEDHLHCSYDELGIYQILLDVKDLEKLRRFCHQQFRILEEYDEKHDSNYLETLDHYYRYNGHIAQIADHMICHRNTINYRIRKIRELTEWDLSDSEVSFRLRLAFCIRRFLTVYDHE